VQTPQASWLLTSAGYSVGFLPARVGRPENQWIVRRGPDMWGSPLPGGRFNASGLVAFAEQVQAS
jgi:hypothetical protein|tara:strand:- start:1180 stop:1374 length:195 start_codon:yes stop_codon:yes gene_type:complete